MKNINENIKNILNLILQIKKLNCGITKNTQDEGTKLFVCISLYNWMLMILKFKCSGLVMVISTQSSADDVQVNKVVYSSGDDTCSSISLTVFQGDITVNSKVYSSYGDRDILLGTPKRTGDNSADCAGMEEVGKEVPKGINIDASGNVYITCKFERWGQF